MDLVIPDDWVIAGIMILAGLVLVLLIIWVIRHMKTGARKLEIELEREKLDILKKDMARKAHPFTRLSPEQLSGLRALEDENDLLETDVYAAQQTVEARIRRLENRLQKAKLSRMMTKIDEEEKRIG